MWKAASSVWFFLSLSVIQAEPMIAGFARFQGQLSEETLGHLLTSELNCTQCHKNPSRPSKGAPILNGVGARLQPDWLRDFLTNPHKTHPGTTMPDVLVDKTQVDALVHFLVSRKQGWKAPRLGKYSAPYTGGKLFKRIGCMACHSDPIAPQASNSLVPLKNLAAKYSYGALTDFLQNPLKHRPGGRMPDLQLELQEAADIAAYLMDTLDIADNAPRGRLQPFDVDEGKAKAGRVIFSQVGCASCHVLGDEQSSLHTSHTPDSADCAKADYALSVDQANAITAALTKPFPHPRVEHTLAALNCYACHRRHELGGPADEHLDHFTGNETVLSGEGKLRSYMPTRMPFFGLNNVEHLVQEFAEVDQPQDIDLSGGDVDAGRILLGTEGGLGCITCHALGDRKGLAMEALSLTGSTKRYRPGWFKENLIHPTKLRPGTLMPSFWPDGVAGNQIILGGNTDRQIAAIWSYLESGQEAPPGYPDFDQGAFEIIPTDRPVIQRTFMEHVGTHAIAVGFPEGVHFAFDAEHCQLAMIWRGRFIDGYKTWFSRMDPSAEPLGVAVKRFSTEPKPRQFRGYTLDNAGVPTFIYLEEGKQITDRIAPDGNGGFLQTISGKGTTSISFDP